MDWRCSVCLAGQDPEKDTAKVATACGHVFCKACITAHVVLAAVDSEPRLCPVCMEPCRARDLRRIYI